MPPPVLRAFALAACAAAGCRAAAARAPAAAPPRGTLVLELRAAGSDSLLYSGAASLQCGGERAAPDYAGPGAPAAWVTFAGAPAGACHADVRRIGYYRTAAVPVHVRAGRTDTVRVRLRPVTCDLDCDPVIVPAPPRPAAGSAPSTPPSNVALQLIRRVASG